MRRTRTQLRNEAQTFFEEIHKIYPQVELAEVFPQRYAGADMWISLGVPTELIDEVLERAVELNSKWADEKDISILVTLEKPSRPVRLEGTLEN